MKATQDFVLYSLPNMHSAPVAQVYKGSLLHVNPYGEGHWTQVKVRDKQGYMLKTNFVNLKRKSVSPKRSRSPRKTKRERFEEPTISPPPLIRLPKEVMSLPLDYKPPKQALDEKLLLKQMDLDEERERKHLFCDYDEIRMKELYDGTQNKPLRQRVISDASSFDFKELAYKRI